jgi:hypothetical protein
MIYYVPGNDEQSQNDPLHGELSISDQQNVQMNIRRYYRDYNDNWNSWGAKTINDFSMYIDSYIETISKLTNTLIIVNIGNKELLRRSVTFYEQIKNAINKKLENESATAPILQEKKQFMEWISELQTPYRELFRKEIYEDFLSLGRVNEGP